MTVGVQKQYSFDSVIVSALPAGLREEVQTNIYKEVFQKINFFSNKSEQFLNLVSSDLRMLFFFEGEILYEQNEIVDYIFFIFSGYVKLWVDLGEWITERSDVAEYIEKGVWFTRPKDVCFLKYVEKSHVADNDIFAELEGLNISKYGGHDSTAIVDGKQSSYFTFPKTKLMKIELLLPEDFK